MDPRRAAQWILCGLLLVTLGARFLAWDRPLYLQLDGESYLFPNIIDYRELRGLDGDRLRDRMGPDDVAWWPPVAHHPNAVRTRGVIAPLEPPSRQHLLGTDDRGRDVLARLIHGTRTTMVTAAGAAILSLLVGVLLSLIAVWCAHGRTHPLAQSVGRICERAIVSMCDVVAAVPALVLVVAVQGLLGTGGIVAIIVLIALPRSADTARIARHAMYAALAKPYCAAARALGCTPGRVLIRHALPHAARQLYVATAVTASTAVLAEAALGFLGFGVAPPAASWGDLLRQAHENGLPFTLVVPTGIAIALVAGALGALAQPSSRPIDE